MGLKLLSYAFWHSALLQKVEVFRQAKNTLNYIIIYCIVSRVFCDSSQILGSDKAIHNKVYKKHQVGLSLCSRNIRNFCCLEICGFLSNISCGNGRERADCLCGCVEIH